MTTLSRDRRSRGRGLSAAGSQGSVTRPHSTGALTLAPHRIGAMVLRYVYLLRSSWTRVLELIYWPAVQLFVWGFLQFYIAQHSGFFARATGVFIAAVLMWDVLFRGQLGFSVSFLEEMWSRNLSNLMISPLRPIEFVSALMLMSLIRLAIGMVPVTLLAIAFFGFNLYSLGLALAAFFLNLILTSWAVGILISGVLLRNGMGAESLAWTLMFVIMPLACVYYPVAVLPDWLQAIAWMLPPTYVFEGMRALVMEHVFRADLMIQAFALNALYFTAGVVAFLQLLKSSRRAGSLLQTGE
jgi:ABC-2 type transport system permease protein